MTIPYVEGTFIGGGIQDLANPLTFWGLLNINIFCYLPIRNNPNPQIIIPTICRNDTASLYSNSPTKSKTQAKMIFAIKDASPIFQPAR